MKVAFYDRAGIESLVFHTSILNDWKRKANMDGGPRSEGCKVEEIEDNAQQELG